MGVIALTIINFLMNVSINIIIVQTNTLDIDFFSHIIEITKETPA